MYELKLNSRVLSTLDGVITENPAAARVFLWLVRHMGYSGGLETSQEYMATALGVSARTIQRAVSLLRDRGLIATARTGGELVYFIDPDAVLRGPKSDSCWPREAPGAWKLSPDPWGDAPAITEDVPLYHRPWAIDCCGEVTK